VCLSATNQSINQTIINLLLPDDFQRELLLERRGGAGEVVGFRDEAGC
jgi:hypothetical protein